MGIKSLEGEVGKLERPLLSKHPRGTELVPMLRYFPNAQGRLRAVFPRARQGVAVFRGKGKKRRARPGQPNARMGPEREELIWQTLW